MVEFPPDFPFNRKAEQPCVQSEPPSDNSSPAEVVTKDHSLATVPSITTEIPPPTTPRVERRKYHRDKLVAQAQIHVDRMKIPPARVGLVDISIAGVRFQAPRPLDVGEKLQIRVEVGPFRWTTRMRVIHCTTNDSQISMIGCAFLRTELLRPWPVAA